MKKGRIARVGDEDLDARRIRIKILDWWWDAAVTGMC